MARLKDHILTVLRGELLAFLPQPHAWLRHAGVLLSLCRASFSSEITVVSSFVALPVRSAIRGGFGSGSGFEHVKRTPDVAVGDGSGVAIVRNTSARRATCCNDDPSRRSHAGAHGPGQGRRGAYACDHNNDNLVQKRARIQSSNSQPTVPNQLFL
jgi:hypothetical protein